MNSIRPTPDEMERNIKRMRKIKVVEPDPNPPKLTWEQQQKEQKKINKAMKKIIKERLDDYSPIEN